MSFDRAEDLRALMPDAQREVPGFYGGGRDPFNPTLQPARLLLA